MTEPFPPRVVVDGIVVDAFPDKESLFARVLAEPRGKRPALVLSLNVHAANLAADDPEFRAIYATADVDYCDGFGIVLAGRFTGKRIPTRLTAADWIVEAVGLLGEAQRTAFFLAGAPGVPDRALEHFTRVVPKHRIVGVQHGFFHQDPALEKDVIARINTLKPDVLFVGLGMPLQEKWVAKRRAELDVGVIWVIGGTLGYFSGDLVRAPAWMGRWGLEWLFRLGSEPRRLFQRYVVGNPRFLLRSVLGLGRRR